MDDNEVVPLQCPISVYRNQAGGVTIKQDQMGMYGVDVLIDLTTPTAVHAIIAALQLELSGMQEEERVEE
jgi:hypothetical protein